MELLFEKIIYYICYLAFFILPFGILLLYRNFNKYNKNSDTKKRGREKLVFPVAEILKPQGVKEHNSRAERAIMFALYPFDDDCSKTTILRRRVVGVLAVIFALGIIWVRFAEPSLLLTKRYDLSLPQQTQKIKIAVASDMHYGVFKNAPNLKRIVEKINKENPDLVFLPGDFVYQAPKETVQGMFAELKNLKAPIFAVWGNHDGDLLGEIDNKQELKVELGRYATMLENEQTEVVVKGRAINLLGLGDLRAGKTNFQKLQTLKADDFNLVLVHNPDAVYFFPQNTNVDLVISGHTHAGQIRVPFLYKLYLPSDFGIEKGVYTIQNIKTLVTSGIGVSILPFRFLVPPEVMFVEI